MQSRQALGKCLAASFVAITALIVIVVLATQWKSSEPLSSLAFASPAPSPSIITTTTTTTKAPTPAALVSTSGCNGLESLCDQPVTDVVFATLHNAGFTTQDGVPSFLANHEKNLEAALEAGYRGLNLDIGWCDDELRLVHGVCGLGTRDPAQVFENILQFLQTHPNEVLLIPLQLNHDTGGPVALDDLASYMRDTVPAFAAQLYQHDASTEWPTLRQLIENETRILLFTYNVQERCFENCASGLNDWFYWAVESAFEFDSPQELQSSSESCAITRGGDGPEVWYAVNAFTRIPNRDDSCRILNDEAFLTRHLQQCAQVTGQTPNVLIVDCWEQGDVLQVVQSFNAQL